jgi:hypothetical protein
VFIAVKIISFPDHMPWTSVPTYTTCWETSVLNSDFSTVTAVSISCDLLCKTEAFTAADTGDWPRQFIAAFHTAETASLSFSLSLSVLPCSM